MNLRAKITVAAGVLLLAGCRELPRYFASGTTIARAGGKELKMGDVRSVVPQGLTGDDSAAFMRVYVDRWVVKQLKLQEAGTLFSSSAAVYGMPSVEVVPEDIDCRPINPYGETKKMIERILRDLYRADSTWSISLLRYFNPVGAHPSGLIGEDPKGIPNNLFPYVTQVAEGKRPYLHVYGDDYKTHDGTGVRDYIHVVDLARAHLMALDRARTVTGVETYNIGTGVGYSVLDVVKAFEAATGRHVPYRIEARRPGDVDACYADPTLAGEVLGWHAQYGLDEMCRDANRWQTMNPDGYGEE